MRESRRRRKRNQLKKRKIGTWGSPAGAKRGGPHDELSGERFDNYVRGSGLCKASQILKKITEGNLKKTADTSGGGSLHRRRNATLRSRKKPMNLRKTTVSADEHGEQNKKNCPAKKKKDEGLLVVQKKKKNRARGNG